MKKIFLLLVAILATVSASAQYEKGNILLTPKIGVNLSNLTSLNDTKIKFGILGGVEGMYMASDKIGISGGLLYSEQGTSFDVNTGSDKVVLSYLNVPILVNFYVAEGFSLKIGVQPGFLLSAKEKATSQGDSKSVDIKESVESLDFSVPLGLSYEFSKIVIEGRYNFGLTKVFKGSNTKESKNSVIQITIGYRFNL